MKLLDLKPRIFQSFPQVRTCFVIGKLRYDLTPDEEVRKDRKELLQMLNLKAEELAFLDQIQSDQGFYFTMQEKINFLVRPDKAGDALYTDSSGIFLSVSSADCLPVLFYSDAASVVGAFHAGWPGTAKKALAKIVKEVVEKFSAPISSFYFFFGPAAQVCCYDVTHAPERVDLFQKLFGEEVLRKEGGKVFLDFVKANIMQLQDLGVSAGQLEDSGICTIHGEEYPSHRRQRATRKETLLSLVGMMEITK